MGEQEVDTKDNEGIVEITMATAQLTLIIPWPTTSRTSIKGLAELRGMGGEMRDMRRTWAPCVILH